MMGAPFVIDGAMNTGLQFTESLLDGVEIG
jgi:hypothetical protein